MLFRSGLNHGSEGFGTSERGSSRNATLQYTYIARRLGLPARKPSAAQHASQHSNNDQARRRKSLRRRTRAPRFCAPDSLKWNGISVAVAIQSADFGARIGEGKWGIGEGRGREVVDWGREVGDWGREVVDWGREVVDRVRAKG